VRNNGYATEPVGRRVALHPEWEAVLPLLLPGLAEAFPDGFGARRVPENTNAEPGTADLVVSLDRLQAQAPAVGSVSLVVAWFGTDLRLGACELRPGVEAAAKTTVPLVWEVAGVSRQNAHLVSRDAQDRPVYGGTPSDASVIQAIQELKARGLRVTFYPFVLMDVPPGNALPDPYSDGAAATGQPAFPWRGRITVAPAPGFAGSPDGTPAARTEVETFFRRPWGLRRMILHYAQLCAAAGGVDAFLIGSELRGLTTLRDGPGSYPAVAELVQLAADVRAILGPGTQISYAADWSEYFGHQPSDGSGDVHHHLDPLWADPNTDFVGIDTYMPLSDWRDGVEHTDAQAWDFVQDRGYLQSGIEGGEGYDWFYASAADRAAQVRTPITDGRGGPDPARFHDRHAPDSVFAAYDGAARGAPMLFHARVRLPAVPAEGVLFEMGRDWSGCWIGLRDGGATFRLRAGNGAARVASGPDAAILDVPTATLPMDGGLHELVWDLRVDPGRVRLWVDGALRGAGHTVGGGPLRAGVWAGSDSAGYFRVGGSGTTEGDPTAPWPAQQDAGELTSWRGSFEEVWRAEPWVFRYKDLRNWWSRPHHDRPGGVRSTTPTPWVPQSKPLRFTEFGCPAVDRGSNQPNVFFDPKSTLDAPAAIGVLAADLPPGPLWRWDHGNALWLDMLEPLASVEDAALFAGANSFALRQPSGAWEILQAAQAQLVAPGRWRLTRLLRGQRGTETAMGAPTPAGSPVVRLDGAVQPLDLAEAELGLPAEWIAGPLGRALGDPAFRSLDFTPAGAGLRPFAPVHVAQPWRTARTPGDLTLRWIRRSRALSADSWELAQVPLAEAAEAWEIDILDGATVKRTLASATTSAHYSAAAQTADWGAPLGPGASLALRIHQLSETLGRGAPGTFTLHF
jgi:hypothetical protein